MKPMLKSMVGLLLAATAGLAAAGNDSVYVYLEAGNSEGGRNGQGYSVDVSRTLIEPDQMRQGTAMKFSDVGTSVAVKAAAGRFDKLLAVATTVTGGPVAMARASLVDTVVASAPGVAWGEPIVYTARMTVSAATVQQPADEPPTMAFFDARIGLGGRLATPLSLSGSGKAETTLSIKYRAYAGEEMGVFAAVLAQGIAGHLSASGAQARGGAQLNAPARLVLTANKPGANITGLSGHTYE